MARISTYQIDSVIHDDDNVIGTDPSSNNATRLFPVASLATFINQTTPTIFPSPVTTGSGAADALTERTAATISYVGPEDESDPNLNSNLAIINIGADGIPVIQRPITFPVFIFEHGLSTQRISVSVYETQSQSISQTGPTSLETIPLVEDDRSTLITPTRVVILDDNRVLVDLGEVRTINANVVILG